MKRVTVFKKGDSCDDLEDVMWEVAELFEEMNASTICERNYRLTISLVPISKKKAEGGRGQ